MLERMQRHGTRSQPHRLAKGESGQALLELALVVPVLVLLVMAIFQFAFVMESHVGLTNAVREAARRVAATEPNATPVWTGSPSLTEWVQSQLCGDATPPCAGGLLADNVQAFDGAKLQPDMPVVTFCTYSVQMAGTPETQYRVQVDVLYKHPVFFGMLAFATDLIDGTGDGLWDLSASAQMRLENVDDTDPLFMDPGACV
jgi:TadE-like protein